MTTLCFGDLEKAKVLAALYNAAKPAGKDMASYDPTPMSYKEAKEISFNKSNFDYIKGRVVLVIFIGNTFNPKLYNKHNGQNAAETIIDSLQKTNDENNPIISKMHQKNVETAIREIKKKY